MFNDLLEDGGAEETSRTTSEGQRDVVKGKTLTNIYSFLFLKKSEVRQNKN